MLKILFITLILAGVTNIYKFQLNAIDAQKIDFSGFRGKKILIVNTATNSKYVSQYSSLEKLHQKYKDSVIVVAVPSNSFGNEPGNPAAIRQLIRGKYNAHYEVAGITEVKGPGEVALYRWLTRSSENNRVESAITGDFHKFLVSSRGEVIGYFIPAIDPMDSLVQRTIEGSH